MYLRDLILFKILVDLETKKTTVRFNQQKTVKTQYSRTGKKILQHNKAFFVKAKPFQNQNPG